MTNRPGPTPLSSLRAVKWTILGRSRSFFHMNRRLFHVTAGLSCFALYAFVLNRESALWILCTVGGSFFIFDLLRLKNAKLNQVALRVMGKIMRREEMTKLSASSYFILGMFTVVLVFPRPIAILAVLYLALGDPAAAIVGIQFGRHKIRGGKSVEGALANALVCFISTWILAKTYFSLQSGPSLALALTGAMASTVAELLPLPIDDNWTIPTVSAAILWGMLALAQYLSLGHLFPL